MPVRTIDFLTLGDEPKDLVEVVVADGLKLQEIKAVDLQWEGPMSDLVVKLIKAGLPSDMLPSSWGWTWEELSDGEPLPPLIVIGIEYEQRWQGAMIIYTDPRPCYHNRGVSGIYLAYIGAAPWNLGYYLKTINQVPLFDDVGEVLLLVAVQKSFEIGCEGRVILHASDDSKGFYRNCGITEIGPDNAHPNKLVRFEITQERAMRFLGKNP